MHPVLNKNLFLVKEKVGMFKAANSFDIYDPESNEVIMECREENLGFFTKLFRFSDFKTNTPFDIDIKTVDGEPLIKVKRGVTLWRSKVQVLDDQGQLIGTFKQKLFSIGAKFEVLDSSERSLCMLKGKLLGWDFKFISDDNKEFAIVTKKWAGFGKEFFTSADNYVLQISNDVPADHPVRKLILAAVMCIDFVLKE